MRRLDDKIAPYKAPAIHWNGHLQTIYPAVFRKIKTLIPYNRNRINTPDNDFLDLDMLQAGNNKVVVVSHGLEGDASRPYMVGLANILFENGFDVCAWNYRSCSGETNRASIMYHSGATYDLSHVINQISADYQEVFLAGFSLGGNLTLKYLGEENVNRKVKKAIAYSVPVDLSSGADHLAKTTNYFYTKRFLKSLKAKIALKSKDYPDLYSLGNWKSIKTIRDFDDAYTAPIHGFANAEDYYRRNSSIKFIPKINVPTLLVTAKNDPFLSNECKSPEIGKGNTNFRFFLTEAGGHCGFPALNTKVYWSEKLALEFFNAQ